MVKDNLGNRMKTYYEEVSKTKLTRRMPVIIRLDGKAFHTFTRGFKKPFDDIFMRTMQETMKYLCENIQGCVLGYTQSDEITLVLIDYKKLNSDAWFDYDVQKIVSISAAMATYAFNKFFERRVVEVENDLAKAWRDGLGETKEIKEAEKALDAYKKVLISGAYFDSRAFSIPREEVANCLIWRQLDAERNSVNSVAQSLFSHKELQGLNLKDTMTKIEQEKGIVWGNLPTVQKRGSCCVKEYWYTLDDGQQVKNKSHITYGKYTGEFYWDGDGYYFFPTGLADNSNCIFSCNQGQKLEVKENSKWVLDTNIPRFVDDREYVEKLICPSDEE